ncbi:MAG TPA: hypothetical protein V6D18_16510 [Thermosynechococcaceae cyanobacterium]
MTDAASPRPSSEELQDLEKLRAVIERAIADGKLTQQEMAAIQSQAWADGKITAEELELYSGLILDKIRSGELEWEF